VIAGQAAEEIFLALLEVPAGERESALASRCAGDGALLAEVRSLLAHHRSDSDFLDPAEIQAAAPRQASLSPGDRLGAYTILGQLGSGGMGNVYIARQGRPARTVALKVIRRELATPGMLRRFEREAELLGRLQHPGIAQIYEAGTIAGADGGQTPFIAMELIGGPNLAAYAREERLDTRARLELVIRICEAVEHAHERGIIHRDLKPANILVDERGQPKVLDFGVARALQDGGEPGERLHPTLHTGQGQLIGTIGYMSPEQLIGHPADVDTRSDVYALGVILFELITQRLPHQLHDKPLPEIARILRDEPAPRLGSVIRGMRGDLEAIVAAALQRDRTRRYHSAEALADDLRRFLAGVPIAARSAPALAHLTRRLQRYRGAVAAGGVVLAVTAMLAAYAWRASERSRRLAIAEARARIAADEAADSLAAQLAASDIERGRLFARSGNVIDAERLLWGRYFSDPQGNAVRWALWELYSRYPQLATVHAHDDGVSAVRWSPDRGLLATGSGTGTLMLWHVGSQGLQSAGEPLRIHSGAVRQIDFASDGALIASAGPDGVHILEAGAREPRRLFAGADIRAIAFHPNRPWLFSGASDGTLRVWDCERQEVVRSVAAHPNAVVQIRFRPGGDELVTVSEDRRALLWDEHLTAPPRAVFGEFASTAAAYSPCGTLLAAAGADNTVVLYDSAAGTQRTLEVPGGSVKFLDFLGDGTLMICGWWSVEFWDLKTGARRTIAAHESVNGVSASPDGGLIAIGQQSGALRLVRSKPAGVDIFADQAGRCVAALSPDGSLLATADDLGEVRIRRRDGGAIVSTFAAAPARIRAMRFSPDGRKIAVASQGGLIRIIDLDTLERVELRNRAVTTAASLAFSADGASLLSAGLDYAVELHSVETGTLERRLTGPTRPVVGVAIGPDGAIAASARDRACHIWLPGQEQARRVEIDETAGWTPAFSSDGTRLLVGYWARQMRVIDPATAKIERVLEGHHALVSDVAFMPGSSEIAASCARDGVVLIWDVHRGEPLAQVDVFRGVEVFSVSFGGGGRFLAVGAAGGQSAVIDLAAYEVHIAGNMEYQRSHGRSVRY
jgi:eukaryotic-like serine/threonine-protein kinase